MTNRTRAWAQPTLRQKILNQIVREGKTDPFMAKLFGVLYEELLAHHFRQQRHTSPNQPVWRWVGHAHWKAPDSSRRIKQDFLLELGTVEGSSPARPGWSTSGRRLVVFEAKSWPGYRFAQLTRSNVEAFLNENEKFLGYLNHRKGSWSVRFDEEKTHQTIIPDGFGFMVFDYLQEDRDAILEAFARRNERLVELESIVDLLSMVAYNQVKDTHPYRATLIEKRDRTRELFDLFLGMDP